MNKMLQHAIDEIVRLPDEEQSSIAALILDELADERRWQEQFSQSQARLRTIVAGVRDEIRKGDIKPASWNDFPNDPKLLGSLKDRGSRSDLFDSDWPGMARPGTA